MAMLDQEQKTNQVDIAALQEMMLTDSDSAKG